MLKNLDYNMEKVKISKALPVLERIAEEFNLKLNRASDFKVATVIFKVFHKNL